MTDSGAMLMREKKGMAPIVTRTVALTQAINALRAEGVTVSGICDSRPKPNRFVTSMSCWLVSCSEASTKVVLHERAKASVSVGLPSPQVEDSMLDTSVAVPGRVVDTGDGMRVSGSATPFSMRAIVVRTLKVEPGA